ncbi:DUF397 domain-containing protein [Saccharopolyspora sp. NPDC050389]|uniref:DUF397 domain-containing protein n=1 Tax=Saccharopolyspora sp. NPDC050389 TaxID=3155516 RepID=UPI0033F2051C
MLRGSDGMIWRKSSRSNGAQNCVEIALAAGLVGVRDTKDRDGGTLVSVVGSGRTSSQGCAMADRLGEDVGDVSDGNNP